MMLDADSLHTNSENFDKTQHIHYLAKACFWLHSTAARRPAAMLTAMDIS